MKVATPVNEGWIFSKDKNYDFFYDRPTDKFISLIDREFAHSLAIEKGLIVKKGVSKKLDLLVVADPNSQSSKARKARDYGVKIIAEAVFWRNIGVTIE